MVHKFGRSIHYVKQNLLILKALMRYVGGRSSHVEDIVNHPVHCTPKSAIFLYHIRHSNEREIVKSRNGRYDNTL